MFIRYIFICTSILIALLSCQNQTPEKGQKVKGKMLITPSPIRTSIETAYILQRSEPDFYPIFLNNIDSLNRPYSNNTTPVILTDLSLEVAYKTLTPESTNKYFSILSNKNIAFFAKTDEMQFKNAIKNKSIALQYLSDKEMKYTSTLSTEDIIEFHETKLFCFLFYATSIIRESNYTKTELIESIIDKRLEVNEILNAKNLFSSKRDSSLFKFKTYRNSIYSFNDSITSDSSGKPLQAITIKPFRHSPDHIPYWDSIYSICLQKRAEIYGDKQLLRLKRVFFR